MLVTLALLSKEDLDKYKNCYINYFIRLYKIAKNCLLSPFFMLFFISIISFFFTFLTDPGNAKEHYQLFVKKKTTKSVKQSEIITHEPKSFENPTLVDIKSVITEHSKTFYELSIILIALHILIQKN